MSNKFFWNDRDTWQWLTAERDADLEDITDMVNDHFKVEMAHIVSPNRHFFRYNLAIGLTTQEFYPTHTQIMVARNKETGKLMAWSWVGRGGHTQYSQEELAEAKFVHCDLTLPAVTRIKMIAQTLQHWIVWCYNNKIPALLSTSIRQDQKAFFRLHEELGFTVNGSYAYKRIIDEKTTDNT